MARNIFIGVLSAAVICAAVYFKDDMKAARSQYSQVEMKMNFKLPKTSPSVSSIKMKNNYTEVEKTLVVKYNNLADLLNNILKVYGADVDLPDAVANECLDMIFDIDDFIYRNQRSIRYQLLNQIDDNILSIGI